MIGGENYMEVIRNSEFGGERPLFESHNLRLENVIIRTGESAIKECSNIEAVDCRFEGNYPFWHVHGFTIERCYFDVGGRSALWYSDHLQMKDTVIDGKAVTDTLSIMTYENSSNSNSESDDDYKHHNSAYDFGWNIGHATRDAVIAITAIVFVFGFPLIIVFIIFFFRYKNRKAKYRLVEQALASGQPLPENLFKEADSTDIRSKGIKNVFVGIGLFIFLWAITEEFGLGCIGLLVMFTGFGQLVIYYTQQDRAPKSNDKSDNARTVFPEKNAEK